MFQVPMRPTKRKLKEGEQIVILKFSVPGPQGLFKKKREIGQYNLIPCGFPYATLFFFFFFKFTLCFSKCLSSGWNTSFLVDGEHLMKKKKKKTWKFSFCLPEHWADVGEFRNIQFWNQNECSCLQRQGAHGNDQLALLRIIIVKLSPLWIVLGDICPGENQHQRENFNIDWLPGEERNL